MNDIGCIHLTNGGFCVRNRNPTNSITKTTRGGPREVCKRCHVANTTQWKRDNPEFRRRQSTVARVKRLKDKYGLTPPQYQEMLATQGGRCAICGSREARKLTRIVSSDFPFIVDHDHSTGEVRGLLCDLCNRALGLFKDSIPVLESAVRYLKEHKNGTPIG